MAGKRFWGVLAIGAVTVGIVSATPAQAYWGGYRGYGGFGPGFGAGLAVGGFYGGYYPRRYGYYPPPYYVAPPVFYAPPPVFVPPPPLAYIEPLPRPRPVIHRVRPVRLPAPQCRCLPAIPSSVPAPLRDVPSPGP